MKMEINLKIIDGEPVVEKKLSEFPHELRGYFFREEISTLPSWNPKDERNFAIHFTEKMDEYLAELLNKFLRFEEFPSKVTIELNFDEKLREIIHT